MRLVVYLRPMKQALLRGSIQADNGFDLRGVDADDLQRNRSSSTNLACRTRTFIGSGTSNMASVSNSVIAGGWQNNATGGNTFIGLVTNNCAMNAATGIVSAEMNVASCKNAVIGAHLGFWYPVSVLRDIDTASVALALPELSTATGSIVEIPILQTAARWPGGRMPSSVEIEVEFNGSVLQPADDAAPCPVGGMCTRVITAVPVPAQGVVGTIRFRVKLGDSPESIVRMTQVTWPDGFRLRTRLHNGKVSVNDLCEDAEGTRYIIAGERTILFPVTPQPAQTTVHVRWNLVASDNISVTIVDMGGRTVTELFAGPQLFGEHQQTADVSMLGAGQYYVVLSTSDGMYMQPLRIVR